MNCYHELTEWHESMINLLIHQPGAQRTIADAEMPSGKAEKKCRAGHLDKGRSAGPRLARKDGRK